MIGRAADGMIAIPTVEEQGAPTNHGIPLWQLALLVIVACLTSFWLGNSLAKEPGSAAPAAVASGAVTHGPSDPSTATLGAASPGAKTPGSADCGPILDLFTQELWKSPRVLGMCRKHVALSDEAPDPMTIDRSARLRYLLRCERAEKLRQLAKALCAKKRGQGHRRRTMGPRAGATDIQRHQKGE